MSQNFGALSQLLNGTTDDQLRAVGLDVLRSARVRKTATFFEFGELQSVPNRLASEKGMPQPFLGNAFQNPLESDFMVGLVDFAWWLVRVGFAVPIYRDLGNFPHRFQYTKAGLRFLDALAPDHPLMPGAVERCAARCTGLTEDVTNLLLQSRQCMEQDLLRPSIVIMGVAYEVAIEAVVESLVRRRELPNDPGRAAARITAVDDVIDRVLPGATSQERDDRYTVHRAYDFAHHLRRRRNDAAHTSPRFGFDDRSEAEELLVSALRCMPSIWAMWAP